MLDPKSVNVVEFIRENTEEGVGVDAAIECSGFEAALNTCVEAVRNHGTVVQTGLHVRKALVDPALWALKDITLEATWCYPVTMWPRVIRMISSGKLPVEKIVTGRIVPDAIVEKGFRSLLNPSGQMKVMVWSREHSRQRRPRSATLWRVKQPWRSPRLRPAGWPSVRLPGKRIARRKTVETRARSLVNGVSGASIGLRWTARCRLRRQHWRRQRLTDEPSISSL